MDNITTVTANFKTPDLTKDCVMSFCKHYPDINHIVVDNGGCTKSIELLRDLQKEDVITLIEISRNIGHGPALNIGITQAETDYVFLLDSDTVIEKGGFLEKMLKLFEKDEKLFACGWLRRVNKESGVAFNVGPNVIPTNSLPYVHPYACLLDVEKFKQGRGFARRGAPALQPMLDAKQNGYTVADFPVQDYIWHKVAGTRGMFGGRFLPKTEEKPGEWGQYNI